MGIWRYYVQRPKSKLWLDTNAELASPALSWALSGPGSGKAIVRQNNPYAEDGQLVWGKFNSLLLAEEDGGLAWAGICSGATPSKDGLQLEFITPAGWLNRVPYLGEYAHWVPNAFDVIRMLINHSTLYEPRMDFAVSTNKSKFTLGDPTPPAKPKQPPRKKGQAASIWQSTAAYKKWQKDNENWNALYADKKPYSANWWTSTYVGDEMDAILKSVGSDYRERWAWTDKGRLEYNTHLDLDDHILNRRDDIEFIDGLNLVDPLDPREGGDDYASRVIALGAGEGRTMRRKIVGDDDGRLYQAAYVSYKNITNLTTLGNLAAVDRRILANTSPNIKTLKIRDVAGYATLGSLRCGDEVRTVSQLTTPAIDTYVRIMKITRDPTTSVVDVDVEQAA